MQITPAYKFYIELMLGMTRTFLTVRKNEKIGTGVQSINITYLLIQIE